MDRYRYDPAALKRRMAASFGHSELQERFDPPPLVQEDEESAQVLIFIPEAQFRLFHDNPARSGWSGYLAYACPDGSIIRIKPVYCPSEGTLMSRVAEREDGILFTASRDLVSLWTRSDASLPPC